MNDIDPCACGPPAAGPPDLSPVPFTPSFTQRKYVMKTRFSAAMARGGAVLALALSGILGSGSALAVGTLAGTSIDNTATLNYSVGSVNQNPIVSSPSGSTNTVGALTTFRVDNKVNLFVDTTQTSPVAVVPGQGSTTGMTTTFTVSNLGNATQSYKLTVTDLSGNPIIYSSARTDNFDVNTPACKIFVGGVQQAFIGDTGPSAAVTGTVVNVDVACQIPLGLANGQLAGISLKAETANSGTAGATLTTETRVGLADDPTAVDVVFAEAASPGDVAKNGAHTAYGAYEVQTASLSVSKTVQVVCDPANLGTGAKAIPGAYLRYTIEVTNNAATAATLATISDVLAANLTFDNGYYAANATVCNGTTANANNGIRVETSFPLAGFPKMLTNLADADGGTYDVPTRTLTVNFPQALGSGTLANGQSVRVIFQTVIN